MEARDYKSDFVRTSVVGAPTVGREVVRSLVSAVEASGASRDVFLRELGLQEQDLNASGSRWPVSEVIGYCQLALAITNDPALGLHWGASIDERDFGPVSLLLAQSSSLRRGFELLSQYELLLHDEPSFEIVESGNEMSIRSIKATGYMKEMASFAAEVMLAGMLTLIRSFSPRAQPISVRVAYAAPAYRAEYERVFGTTVHFNQPVTELVFERSLLDQRSLHGDTEMRAAMQTVAEQRLLRMTRRAPHAAKLRDWLLSRAPERTTMEQAARALGLSARSLRRQLAAEETTYREVEYAVLEVVARRLLCDVGLTIQETAHEMGFSDAATFHRAFKTWTGLTPSEFRERAVAAQARFAARR